jgi:hypothetical protein
MSKGDTPTHDSNELDRLIAGHLDDCLSDAEAAALASLLVSDETAADRLAQAALLHAQLRELLTADEAIAAASSTSVGTGSQPSARGSGSLAARRSFVWAGAVVAVVILVMLRMVPTSASAAAVALDRLIAAAEHAAARQYRIEVLAWEQAESGPAEMTSAAGRGRKPGLNNAVVTIQGPDAFVLQRQFDNGSVFLTGADGEVGWSVPPRGPVHVSHDPRRFRRGLPGERDGIPFIALPAGLSQLRQGYALSVSDADEGVGDGVQRLTAVRQKSGQRGPTRVDLWFGAEGFPQRIRIEGLPRDNGNPEDLEMPTEQTVEFVLVGTAELEDDFFRHEAHHGDDREVRWE